MNNEQFWDGNQSKRPEIKVHKRIFRPNGNETNHSKTCPYNKFKFQLTETGEDGVNGVHAQRPVNRGNSQENANVTHQFLSTVEGNAMDSLARLRFATRKSPALVGVDFSIEVYLAL